MQYRYLLTFPDGTEKTFVVELDDETLALKPPPRTQYPDWTLLLFDQCTNCPLTNEQSLRCPIAANLVDVFEFFKGAVSYDEVEVEITCRERTYKKKTDLQHVLGSLLGIYMVTSGCPVMDKLRPLVKTHLPFATVHETAYRAVSMYLTAQYFVMRHGGEPDFELKGLPAIYVQIQIVNQCFHERIADARTKDATLNAIAHLDSYARFSISVIEDGLSDLDGLFRPYTESRP